jgi:dipeptidase D
MKMDSATTKILKKFEQISSIPRCSKKEAKIAAWVENWADQAGYAVRKDAVGNMCITLPASPGHETAPVIVIQGHLDMVCVKTETSDHDFDKDPIRLATEEDWLTADQTTLGADNGIAIAMALALAENTELQRPPIELLFTVDEESGLIGANKMEPGFVSGKILLNLDSEEEGEFTVGCAGGKDTLLTLGLEFSPSAEDWEVMRLSVQGLRGGHSGIDIGKHRGSANKLLARALHALSRSAKIRLGDINGGITHNAIARDAHALVMVEDGRQTALQSCIDDFSAAAMEEYAKTEPDLAVTLSPAAKDETAADCLTERATQRIIQLLMALPHGVARMSAAIPGLVETSNNLATIKTADTKLEILSSQRSSSMSRLAEITARIESIAALAGATISHENSYPAWPPNMQSALIDRCKSLYMRMFDKEPLIQTIHAGLECGLIGAKHPGMDMISFGPTIENPHSPHERLHIPSIAKTWEFLVALLASYTE